MKATWSFKCSVLNTCYDVKLSPGVRPIGSKLTLKMFDMIFLRNALHRRQAFGPTHPVKNCNTKSDSRATRLQSKQTNVQFSLSGTLLCLSLKREIRTFFLSFLLFISLFVYPESTTYHYYEESVVYSRQSTNDLRD